MDIPLETALAKIGLLVLQVEALAKENAALKAALNDVIQKADAASDSA